MKEQTAITYDLSPDDRVPKAGEYLVSIGKRGINSVWRIAAVRKIKHKGVRESQGYVLTVEAERWLQLWTVYDPETNQVWVRGDAAHTLVWYPRGKKHD